jgi:hypothetical protein
LLYTLSIHLLSDFARLHDLAVIIFTSHDFFDDILVSVFFWHTIHFLPDFTKVFLDTSIVPLMPLLEAGKKVCILEVLLDDLLKLGLDLVALVVLFWLFLDLFQRAFKNSFQLVL